MLGGWESVHQSNSAEVWDSRVEWQAQTQWAYTSIISAVIEVAYPDPTKTQIENKTVGK